MDSSWREVTGMMGGLFIWRVKLAWEMKFYRVYRLFKLMQHYVHLWKWKKKRVLNIFIFELPFLALGFFPTGIMFHCVYH